MGIQYIFSKWFPIFFQQLVLLWNDISIFCKFECGYAGSYFRMIVQCHRSDIGWKDFIITYQNKYGIWNYCICIWKIINWPSLKIQYKTWSNRKEWQISNEIIPLSITRVSIFSNERGSKRLKSQSAA